MASINASTAGGGGIITTADATGILQLQSAGTATVTVDASGNVGIGTASPQSLLDLTGNDPTLRFTDNAGSPAATWSLRSNDANFSVRSVTAGADRLVIDSAGASTFTGTGKFATTIGVGNATPSASGSGITFPATQSASSDANTLDDYEEGTWTPSVGGTATYGARAGRYTKIGNIVYIQGQQDITLLGTGSASTLSGLPFTAASASSEGGFNITYFANLAVNVIQPVLGVDAATTSCTVYSRTTAGVAASTVSVFGNSARMFFYGHYQVA